MTRYLIEVGEDGGGTGRPFREGDSLRAFLAERLARPDCYWGQGRDPDTADSDPSLLTGWPGVTVLGAMAWPDEPAVWALVDVPDGTRVLDFGGAAVENRYHAPCVELVD